MASSPTVAGWVTPTIGSGDEHAPDHRSEGSEGQRAAGGSSLTTTTETIGVISDTHGQLRPEAVAALQGCDRIIHAGDVGTADVLDGLRLVAPTVAVRGNVDTDDFGMTLPRSRIV
jgi:hypothetical protein